MMTELLLVAAGLAVVVIAAVAWRGIAARKRLSGLLDEEDPAVRGLALMLMARDGSMGAESAERVRELADDEDPFVRAAALANLGPLLGDDPELAARLLEELDLPGSEHFGPAGSALAAADLHGPEAAEKLIAKAVELDRQLFPGGEEAPDLDASVAMDQMHATQLLGDLGAGEPEVAKRLASLWREGDAHERAVALDALLRVLRRTRDEIDEEAPVAVATAVAERLGLDRTEIVRCLAADLDPDHEREGLLKVLLLEELGPGLPEARHALLGALGSEESGEAAAMALERFGEDAREELEGLARDERPRVREHALQALAALGANRRRKVAATSTAPLLEALQDTDPEVRAQAAWSLGGVDPAGEEIVRALAERLRSDRYPSVRWNALQALGRIGPPAGIAAREIVGALEDPSWVLRWSGAHWVAMVGPALLDELEGLAASGSPNGRAGVRRVARAMRNTGAVRLSRAERKRLDGLAIGMVTEPEITSLLAAIERGEVELTSDREPGEVYSGDCYYETDDGWQLVVFNDCGQWDYLDGIQAPDGRVTGHDEIDVDLPQVEFHDPEAEASWRAWGIRKPEADDGTRWLDGRRPIPAWNAPREDESPES